MRRGGGWGEELTRLEPGDDVPTTCKAINTHSQLGTFVVVPDVLSKFSNRECFLLQMKCRMSVSVEIIFY